MAHFSLIARVLVGIAVAAGAAVLVVAAFALSAPLGVLALLAAAVVVTELIQVEARDDSLDPLDAHPFSFSSGVHIGAVLIFGPWAGALVAAFGVVVADGLRSAPIAAICLTVAAFFVLAGAAARTPASLASVRASLASVRVGSR